MTLENWLNKNIRLINKREIPFFKPGFTDIKTKSRFIKIKKLNHWKDNDGIEDTW